MVRIISTGLGRSLEDRARLTERAPRETGTAEAGREGEPGVAPEDRRLAAEAGLKGRHY